MEAEWIERRRRHGPRDDGVITMSLVTTTPFTVTLPPVHRVRKRTPLGTPRASALSGQNLPLIWGMSMR